MKTMFSNNNLPTVHGMGYIVKEMNIHQYNFTFLSKIGTLTPGGVKLAR